MKQKTIFFDIDGTLLTTKDGKRFWIPPSNLEALRRLKQNGHRVAICSGRQEKFIQTYFPGIFNSYVAMNGSHVVFEGKTIAFASFTTDRVKELMRHFDQYGCSYTFVGRDYAWAHNLPDGYLKVVQDLYGLPGFVKTEWQPEEVEACMMDFAFRDEDHYQKCLPAYHGSMVLNRHPGSLTADLSFREHDKANGIEIFLKHTGIDRADTFAFGDGYNDVTMMQAVGCGIAMGNGVPAVKEAADYITDSIFDDGIYKALEHFSLI